MIRPLLEHAKLPTLLALVCLSLIACEEKKTPEPPKTNTPPVNEVAKTPDPPKEDPEKAAKEKAIKQGEETAIRRSDKVQIVAANIESAMKSAPTKKPRIRTKKATKYNGSIEARLVAKEIGRYNGAMKSCYERSLKRSPGLEGKVELSVVVGSNGKTKSARARGLSLRDASISKCMEGHAKKMKFPAPKGGLAQVKKVYAFKPDV